MEYSILTVKIGGSLIGEEEGERYISNIIEDMKKILSSKDSPYNKILIVHGGGKSVDEEMKKRGLEIKKICSPSGIESRYTYREARDVYVDVMKKIKDHLVERMKESGISAYGIDPQESPVICERKESVVHLDEKTKKRMIIHDDYSGEMITKDNIIVNIKNKIYELFEENDVIVVPPVGVFEEEGKKVGLNVNGDKLAAYLSGCVGSKVIVDLTDVEGVYKGGKIIPEIAFIGETDSLIDDEEIRGGMKRKILEGKEAFDKYNPRLEKFIIASGKKENPITLALNGEGCTVIKRG
ncbi:MAG: hypothetical protein QXU74_02540 [Candidatus Aenigmatarchaeota archaeon]